MKNHPLLRISTLGLALFAAGTSLASACPACYGDTTGSKMGNAADIGIIAMVIIMLFMLAAVGAFMAYLVWRAKNPLPDYDELLREDDAPAADAHGYLPPAQPEAL
jgi:hypothetical protein